MKSIENDTKDIAVIEIAIDTRQILDLHILIYL